MVTAWFLLETIVDRSIEKIGQSKITVLIEESVCKINRKNLHVVMCLEICYSTLQSFVQFICSLALNCKCQLTRLHKRCGITGLLPAREVLFDKRPERIPASRNKDKFQSQKMQVPCTISKQVLSVFCQSQIIIFLI